MSLNYQQALSGLCFVLVILLTVDIRLRWSDEGKVGVVYTPNSNEAVGNPSVLYTVEHEPPKAERLVYHPLTPQEIEAANKVANLARDEEDYVLKNAIIGTKHGDDCQVQKNIFFLKSSKTGSTTMMSIFQRFGLKYKARFLMGENHGGMAVNNRPFNLDMDCWIGKNMATEKIEFELSTNHLHYNGTAVDHLMKKPFVKIGIAREPESHFISSYNFYHNLMPKLTYRLNPTAEYNLARKKMSRHNYGGDKKPIFIAKPTKQDVKFEIDVFLRHPWEYIKEFGTNSFAWMANIRPQLLFYGKSPIMETPSFSQNLTRGEVLDWVKDIAESFDLMMILEYFDYSLALISIQFCIPTEDLIYIAVNQRHDHSEKEHLPPDSQSRLKELNWPDYLFYQAMNITFWRKIEFYGEDEVIRVSNEIKRKSRELSDQCIDFDNNGRDKLIDRVFLKEAQETNATCLKLQFQGVRASKLFMVSQIDEVMKKSKNKYKFCGSKLAYGNDVKEYQVWKHVYLERYNALLD